MYINTDTITELLQKDLNLFKMQKGELTALESATVASIERSLTKKYLPGDAATTEQSDAAALSLFLKNNEECARWGEVLRRGDSRTMEYLEDLRTAFLDFFYPDRNGPFCRSWDADPVLSRTNIYKGLYPGPGASIGSKSTDLYSKLATSSLACTGLDLHMFYREAVRTRPSLERCETFRADRKGVELVRGSKLSFVPKTAEISRVICTEPLLNMLFQKGIGSAIEDRLDEVFAIRLEDQPAKNAELARKGSVTGAFGTIDLKSASDTIAMTMVEALFPATVFAWLVRTRSPEARLPSGEVVELQMISSMGNGFTFPLQTLIFAACVYVVYRRMGLRFSPPRGKRLGTYGVFGDDIVVRREAFDEVVSLLHSLGFTVNVDKSFNTGLFRESCGSDYFEGWNVRGVYLKTLQDYGDLYSAANRLVRWCARTGILLPSLLDFFCSACKGRYSLYVPWDESDDAGLKVPFDMFVPRFGAAGNGCTRYRYLKRQPKRVSIPEGEGAESRTSVDGLKGWFYNPDGLLVACAAGAIRSGTISFRSEERLTKFRTKVTPRWDYVVPDEEIHPLGCGWKTAANLLVS